ncbi:MvdC/MvdD family ATP grasp protein [Marinicrinis lubricantis]|uniref:MvdC/MvdD family ATP grasp protein n=1 Tax=Marinicrinis lubricantis TaxID=2086470 RepID=A0ABW1IPF3_9BACL
MRILVITQQKDATVQYMTENYKNEAQWFRLNVDDIENYEIEIQSSGIRIKSNNDEIMGDEIEAVYYRKVAYPDLTTYDPEYHTLIQRELIGLVEGLVETLGRKCLSRPSILRRAENKIFQLHIAKNVGFQVPDSFITNAGIAATQFSKKQLTVVKPLATGTIVNRQGRGIIQTNLVDTNYPIEGLGVAPAYFQEYIRKNDGEYRITIIDRTVYAVEIRSSDPVDWRKSGAENDYRLVSVPDEVIVHCFHMMDLLGISFGAFDFIKRGEEFFFLEVNPNGQWLWLEEKLNIPISRSIVTYLTTGC